MNEERKEEGEGGEEGERRTEGRKDGMNEQGREGSERKMEVKEGGK
jgi:hypothetical protein